jgi:hypothetical protein
MKLKLFNTLLLYMSFIEEIYKNYVQFLRKKNL